MENQNNYRCNNFNILRFLAAIMVMAGHMAFIDGSNNVPMIWGQGIQSLGVKVFFLIGGYLISKSWLSDSNPVRYGIKRIFRIFPPLIIYVLIVAFVIGPVLSKVSTVNYFLNGQTYRYLLNILMFPIYSLPGVFENNPYPNAVNGSLWTLPVEILMYILVPILLTISKRKGKLVFKTYVAMMLIVCLFQIVHLWRFPTWRFVIWGTDLGQAFSLVPYYFIGILFTFEEVRKYINLQKSVVLILAFCCVSPFLGGIVNEVVTWFVLPFFVFSFGLDNHPYFGKMPEKFEISYGIYLYGFFVQQVIVSVFNGLQIQVTTLKCFVVSILFTGIMALFSKKYIEIPFSKFAKKLCSSVITHSGV